MNILIITQYFWPENFKINDLALGLLERGHTVTVLTGSPNYPHGKIFEGYGCFNREQNYYGVKIIRVPLIPRGNGGGFRLALNYISFAVTASLISPLFCKDNYDIVFVFEPSPITIGVPAVIIKTLKSVPVLFWVQDLWPESLSATGAVKSKALLALIGKMVSFIYKRCDRILIQSRSFADSVVQQGGNPNHILYFPNSAESVFNVPAPASRKVPLLPEGFKIMFAGNIGAAQDFGTIIAAAKLLQHYNDIHWIIVGDGRMRSWAETEVLSLGLTRNFHFLGQHPIEDMPSFFSSADTLLVTLRKEPIFALTIPSKIQSYLASGRPIIAAFDGEGAKIAMESGAGISCPAEDPHALAQAVVKMYETPMHRREEMGMSGRIYYNTHFDRDMLLDKLIVWMNALARK